MKRTLGAVLALTLTVALGACGPKRTQCTDGSTSKSTGRGTCSGHGGVKATERGVS